MLPHACPSGAQAPLTPFRSIGPLDSECLVSDYLWKTISTEAFSIV